MRLAGSVSYRPVRIGFLVPPDDLALVSRVARLCSCLWGGRCNPIIPFFETGGARWVPEYKQEGGINVARGYVDFFELDVLVEAVPGMADRLGWKREDRFRDLPRALPLDGFYEKDSHGRIHFSAGIDILEVMHHLHDREYQYERRHKRPFLRIDPVENNAFFDVVGGRYPNDEQLGYITDAYREVFDPETVPATFETAQKLVRQGCAGPIWITRHGLKDSLGRGGSDETFHIFDPSDAGDVIDFWNLRLVERRLIPVSIEWLAQESEAMRRHIVDVHRPIPDNPFGTKFHTSVQFANSISDKRLVELSQQHLAGLPQGSFYPARSPILWSRQDRGYQRRHSQILSTGKAVSFDEEASADRYVRVPAPSPEFLGASGRYSKSHWVNVIAPSNSSASDDDPALVYPSNFWNPGYPSLSTGHDLRVGRQGWVLIQEHSIGYSLIRLQTGREAIVGWLKTHNIDATPSEEGQVAAQVIGSAGNLLACGMFADRETILLLNEMAEGHATPVRNGARVAATTPDRSKHINTVRQHFDRREKRSFGYWNQLDYFLERSVFRAGLRVHCPVCGYQNWFDLNAMGYALTCLRCLKEFKFAQSPKDLHDVDWFYRVIGPFAAPDYARGAYAVALTLRSLAPRQESEMTWSTGLKLGPLNCEVDFVAWFRAGGILREERDDPLLLIGEAKSFGKNVIDDHAIASLKKTAERFPGALMVVSSLREIGNYAAEEIGRLRELALWGRRSLYQGQPCNPLIVLTATEVFADHNILEGWSERTQGWIDPTDLHQLAELTLHKYLGLPGYWETWAQEHQIAWQRQRILRLIARRGTQ